MKIALINPPRVKGYPVVREERYEHRDLGALYPPLGLLTSAAVLIEQGHDVSLLDANGFDLGLSHVRSFLESSAPDLVFLRLGFDTQEEDLACCDVARRVGAKTVVRNKIIGDVPEIRRGILESGRVDMFLDGDPEVLLPLACQSAGQAGPLPPGILTPDQPEGTGLPASPWQDLDALPMPAYHLLPKPWPYHTGIFEAPVATLWTSRGCPHRCSFCAYGREKHRKKSPERVLAEIELLVKHHGVTRFLFFDDLMDADEARMAAVCEGMISRFPGVRWVACARADGVSEEGLILMRRAGCIELAIGIESGSPSVLERTHKGITPDQIERASRACHRAGLLFYGMVVLGLPGETEGTVRHTVDFLRRIDPFYVQFCFATPFPNTPAYEYYERQGLLLTKDWSRYFPLSEEPVVRTHALSKEDLMRLRRWAYGKMLFRPGHLLRQARRGNWGWRVRAGAKLAGRMLRLVSGMPIR